MKNIITSFVIVFAFAANAQVPLVSVVEHFTNSRCGTCAAVNPGAYTTMNLYPNSKHISYYPSSPYNNCFFSMQNPTEQDGRTQWYGVYGSTPRFVVNGVQSSSAQLGNSLMQGQTQLSSFEIRTIINELGNNQREIEVIIKKVAASSEINGTLFVSIFEDTVFQATPNGEAFHQDVFRKAITAVSGETVTLPSVIGDSIDFSFTVALVSEWNTERLRVLSLLQNNQKELIQANESNYFEVSNTVEEEDFILKIQNPVKDFIKLQNNLGYSGWEIFDINGRKVKEGKGEEIIPVIGIENGLYFIYLKELSSTYKIIINH